jgi:hypothetical protein
MICSRGLGMDQVFPLQYNMQSTGLDTDEDPALIHYNDVKKMKNIVFWANVSSASQICYRVFYGLVIGNILDKPTERRKCSTFLCNIFCIECKLLPYVCGCSSTTEEMKIVWNACEKQPCCGDACCYFYPLPYRVN